MNGRWMFDVTRAAAARAGGGEGGRGGNRAADILLRMSHKNPRTKEALFLSSLTPPPPEDHSGPPHIPTAGGEPTASGCPGKCTLGVSTHQKELTLKKKVYNGARGTE